MTNRRFNVGLLALLFCLPAVFAVREARADPERTISLTDVPCTGGAPVMTSSLTPTYPRCALRIAVSILDGETNSVFRLVFTNAAGKELLVDMNGGTALEEGEGNTFTYLVPYGCTYNFEFATTTRGGTVVFEEVPGDSI